MSQDPSETQVTTFPGSGDVVASRLHADGVMTATCTRPDGVTVMTVYVPRSIVPADVPAVVALYRPAGAVMAGAYAMADLDADMSATFAYAVAYDVTDTRRGAAA